MINHFPSVCSKLPHFTKHLSASTEKESCSETRRDLETLSHWFYRGCLCPLRMIIKGCSLSKNKLREAINYGKIQMHTSVSLKQ